MPQAGFLRGFADLSAAKCAALFEFSQLRSSHSHTLCGLFLALSVGTTRDSIASGVLMYGLVNQMVQDYVTARHGEAVWARVAIAAQLDGIPFVLSAPYPDSLTYTLVGATCAETGLPSSDVLIGIGHFFTGYASSRGYEDLMRAAGGSFPLFLDNLDRLHSQLGNAFPELRPPSFHVSHVTEDTLRLHYYSTREGLAPMVIGLMQSLGDRFNLQIHVELLAPRGDGQDHDEFAIRFAPRQA